MNVILEWLRSKSEGCLLVRDISVCTSPKLGIPVTWWRESNMVTGTRLEWVRGKRARNELERPGETKSGRLSTTYVTWAWVNDLLKFLNHLWVELTVEKRGETRRKDKHIWGSAWQWLVAWWRSDCNLIYIEGRDEGACWWNECVKVEWILRPCTEMRKTGGWGVEGRGSSVRFGEENIWMPIRQPGGHVNRQLHKQSGTQERDWAGRINVGITSIDVVFSIRGLDEINHRVSL